MSNDKSTTTYNSIPYVPSSGPTSTPTRATPHPYTTLDRSKTATASLSVNAGPLNRITLSPASATITAGGSQSYSSQGFEAGIHRLGYVVGGTTFTISPDGSCMGVTCTATDAGPPSVTISAG